MEQDYKKSKNSNQFATLATRASTANSAQQNVRIIPRPTLKKLRNNSAKLSSMRRLTSPSSRNQKRKASTIVQKIQQFEKFYEKKASNPPKKQPEYISAQFTLSDNQFIFQQDAFKLQNLITGGYCWVEEYMSLSKFNRTKDNFVLLKDIYDKAKNHDKANRLQKQTIKRRNIFSVVYLNQNLKQMYKKDEDEIFKRLKISK